jgi:hypothetical protein
MIPASVFGTIQLVEDLIPIVTQGITSIKAALSGGKSADSSLSDADANYATLIAAAQAIIAAHAAGKP